MDPSRNTGQYLGGIDYKFPIENNGKNDSGSQSKTNQNKVSDSSRENIGESNKEITMQNNSQPIKSTEFFPINSSPENESFKSKPTLKEETMKNPHKRESNPVPLMNEEEKSDLQSKKTGDQDLGIIVEEEQSQTYSKIITYNQTLQKSIILKNQTGGSPDK
mmetsp:Transcript_2091/g.2653  ORF Transcript_2091/g.2653 Transcript_2091/m.2653 type:complete len:162 (+) Transcript_2091:1164-1649(+)